MPAIITHHIFGEDASRLLPEGILTSEEDLLAFLLGNQGPDPLWARVRTSPWRAQACHRMAVRMHESHVIDTFMALRDATARTRETDMHVARAFVLGLAAHYLLDSMTHPLVYAQQRALVDADQSLADSQSQIHALLEADIDSWMLWQKRKKTVLDAPCWTALVSTEHINGVAGALFSQVAWQVFDIELGASEYGQSVGDYRLFYRLIDPPADRMPQLLATVEHLFRPHSRLLAQAHRIIQSDDCPSANLEHHPWTDPQTGIRSTASVPDLFHDALLAWPAFAQHIVEGDRSWLERATAGIDYNGRAATQG